MFSDRNSEGIYIPRSVTTPERLKCKLYDFAYI